MPLCFSRPLAGPPQLDLYPAEQALQAISRLLLASVADNQVQGQLLPFLYLQLNNDSPGQASTYGDYRLLANTQVAPTMSIFDKM